MEASAKFQLTLSLSLSLSLGGKTSHLYAYIHIHARATVIYIGLVFYTSDYNMAHLSVHTWHRWCYKRYNKFEKT